MVISLALSTGFLVHWAPPSGSSWPCVYTVLFGTIGAYCMGVMGRSPPQAKTCGVTPLFSPPQVTGGQILFATID